MADLTSQRIPKQRTTFDSFSVIYSRMELYIYEGPGFLELKCMKN